MIEYSSKIKKRIETIKLEALHEVYTKAFVYLFILGFIIIVLKSDDSARMIKEIIINILSGGSFIVFLYTVKLKIKSFHKRYWIYLVTSLTYSIAAAMITADKFLTTSGIGLVIFAVLIFFSFSQLHLLVYIITITLVIGTYTYTGINQQVNLTNTYPVTAVGSFLILGYILLRGAKLFREYEAMLYKQLNNLDEKNIELAALNEEFKATEEEIIHQYNEIHQLNDSLTHRNAQIEAIINTTENAFIGFDPEKNFFEFSSNVKGLLHLEKIVIKDNFPLFLKSLEDSYKNRVRNAWNDMLYNEAPSRIVDIKYPINGIEYDFQLTFLRYTEGLQKQQLVVAIKDITNLKESERLKDWKIYYDEMTGLLNRNGFSYKVNQLILKDSLDFYVILFNVDDFKYINTSFGYSIGDQIIIEIGKRIRNCNDNIKNLAHLDGDSFVVTVHDGFDVKKAIHELEKRIGTILIDDIEFNITCSTGIGIIEEAKSATVLIRKAELAMHAAKAKGKKQHAHYSDAFNTQVARKYKIVQALEKIDLNKEMYLVYQPKVTTNTNKIVGFESLVRWESEELGFIGPMEFIDLAEKTGQIIEVGYYIMNEAMIFAKESAELDPNIIVSINISAKQLIKVNFIKRVTQIISEIGVRVQNIGFEVTETVYVEDLGVAETTLKSLSKLGIKLYLDDFGTGYSSLSYLDRLPINYLKIDKAFIDKIHINDKSKHMLKAILGLASILGIKCVAEGVELKEQVEILKEEGCELIQGYYFDRPLPRAEALRKVGHIYNQNIPLENEIEGDD